MRTRGQAVLFGTCYGNWNEPHLGEDLAAVFEHNGIPVRLAPKERCCGMPRLELGDLETVEKAKDANVEVLAKLVDEGFDIVAPVPSCVLMFKQELPLMFPEDERVAKVKAAIYDPFEYLAQRHREGLLRTDFRHSLGTVAYHAACHQRVQNIGSKTREILDLVPDTRVTVIERCSGHDGTYAVKRESYPHTRCGSCVRSSGGCATRRPTTSGATVRWRGTTSPTVSATADPPTIHLPCCARRTASESPGRSMNRLRREDLLGLEQYAAERAAFRERVIRHKHSRRLPIGPNATLHFEDRLTMQYQVQEILRTERIFEPEEIEAELEAYNPLIPDGSNWKATFMIEFDDEGRTPIRPRSPGRYRGPGLGPDRRLRSRVGHRGRRPRSDDRRKDLVGPLSALRASTGARRRRARRCADRGRHRSSRVLARDIPRPRGGARIARRGPRSLLIGITGVLSAPPRFLPGM